ncbi:hypothetical protein TNCV_98551 [Trichonephila clavipes]|nr:hypothetical protein TNCV_98551 [Trichonephila clavipes]
MFSNVTVWINTNANGNGPGSLKHCHVARTTPKEFVKELLNKRTDSSKSCKEHFKINFWKRDIINLRKEDKIKFDLKNLKLENERSMSYARNKNKETTAIKKTRLNSVTYAKILSKK